MVSRLEIVSIESPEFNNISMDTTLFPEDIVYYYSDEERQDDARDLSLLLDYGSIF
jgi:hypothetical protein